MLYQNLIWPFYDSLYLDRQYHGFHRLSDHPQWRLEPL